MHYHLEIIMPPTNDVEAAIKTILAPFDENADVTTHAFWDYYGIGGRWTGAHDDYEPINDPRNYEACYLCMGTGFRSDDLGNNMRQKNPSYACNACGSYSDGKWTHGKFGAGKKLKFESHWQKHEGDIVPLSQIKDDLKAARVIIAAPDDDGKMDAVYMIESHYYNGINYIDVKWDGTVKQAINLHLEKCKNFNPEYAAKIVPKDDWISVTVDYHC